MPKKRERRRNQRTGSCSGHYYEAQGEPTVGFLGGKVVKAKCSECKGVSYFMLDEWEALPDA